PKKPDRHRLTPRAIDAERASPALSSRTNPLSQPSSVPSIPGDRSHRRVGLPLCFGASLTLHACLMAMSSVWMSGGASLPRAESDLIAGEDEELETFAIYVRIPES